MATRFSTGSRTTPTCGHPGRKHCAKGMCGACYQKRWAAIHPDQRAKHRSVSRPREKERFRNLSLEEREVVYAKLRERSRQWRAKNREKHLEQSRKVSRSYYHSERGKRCHRNCRLKAMFGISLDDYEAMLASQGGVCAICKRAETTVRRGVVVSLAVDHCHETGKVRGLLCQACNVMIGHGRNDPDCLRAAIAYLERSQQAAAVA